MKNVSLTLGILSYLTHSEDNGLCFRIKEYKNSIFSALSWKMFQYLQKIVQNQKEPLRVQKSRFGCVFCTAAVTRRYFPLFELVFIIAQGPAIDTYSMNEGAIMVSRKYYESEFDSYPDLVILKEMRKMLGGITEKKALGLLHSKQIKTFYIEQRYLIPKICIIDYLLNSRQSPANDKMPKKPVRNRKSGTGCLRQLNENLWEGKYAPINARSQRIARHVYAKTQAECERKLLRLIEDMKAEISAEKIFLNQQCSKPT